MGVLSKRIQQKFIDKGYDLELISDIQPHGNINFKTSDRFFSSGNGVSTILYVFTYPSNQLRDGWISEITAISGTHTFFSFTLLNDDELTKQLKKAIQEKDGRVLQKGLHRTEKQKELIEASKLSDAYNDIDNNRNPFGLVYTRIFVTKPTVEELFERVSEIKQSAKKFDIAIFSGELELEFETPFVKPSNQLKMPNHLRGEVFDVHDVAGGYFFDYSKLEDEKGTYFGYTDTSGAVNFDFMKRDNKRTRSFMMLAGNPKMGQQLFAHHLIDDLYSKGHFIRNFDTTGAYKQQTETQHGLILSMASSENSINMFQVFPTDTKPNGLEVDEIASFKTHIEKLKTILKLLNSNITSDDLTRFEKNITNFYIDNGLWFRNPEKHFNEIRITKIKNEECLTLEDYVLYLKGTIRRAQNISNITEYQMRSFERIFDVFSGLLSNHINIFGQKTRVKDISSEKVVTFDFSGLQSEILNVQLFSALTFISSDINTNGKRCKQLMKKNNSIREEDLPHHIVNLPDAKRLINRHFSTGVSTLSNIINSMGWNFGGIILQFDSLQDVLFPGMTSSTYNSYVSDMQTIIGKMQYRVFAELSETDIQLLDIALGNSMSKAELSSLTKFQKHQLLLSISGIKNIIFTQQQLPTDLERYGVIE